MTVSALDWLPDRHLGVAATLAHVDELIEQIGMLLFQYQNQGGGVIELKEVPRGAMSQSVVSWIAPIPRKVPLLVADALTALRAAVEHTLYAEAEFVNGGSLDEKVAKSIEMPARLKYDDFDEWVKKRPREAPKAMRAGGELLRRVESLQPFHRNIRPDLHPMARLASHTNHSKHRTPAITAVRLVALVADDEAPMSSHDLPLRDEAPLRVGEVITETPLGIRVQVTLFPSVGINRPGTDEWPILMRELDEIAQWVRTQAVPQLITGGISSEAALPARYEIGIGQLDDRLAIAQGSIVSAGERNKTRLGAASARASLVDLLLPMPETPDGASLSAWLNSLTDAEVLDRVTTLKPGSSRDASLLETNMAAIKKLHEEAVMFAQEARSQ